MTAPRDWEALLIVAAKRLLADGVDPDWDGSPTHPVAVWVRAKIGPITPSRERHLCLSISARACALLDAS